MKTMKTWALQDAKNRFSTVADRAWQGEPQVVTRRGKPLVVVISYAQYEERVNCNGKSRSLVDAFMQCPEELEGLIGSRKRNVSQRRKAVFA